MNLFQHRIIKEIFPDLNKNKKSTQKSTETAKISHFSSRLDQTLDKNTM